MTITLPRGDRCPGEAHGRGGRRDAIEMAARGGESNADSGTYKETIFLRNEHGGVTVLIAQSVCVLPIPRKEPLAPPRYVKERNHRASSSEKLCRSAGCTSNRDRLGDTKFCITATRYFPFIGRANVLKVPHKYR